MNSIILMIYFNSLWIGSDLSNLEIASLLSHLKCGHEIHLWTYSDIGNVPKDVIIRDGREILPASEIFSYKVGEGEGSLSAFSNYFRYKLLLENGGWWVDTDVICLREFDFEEDCVIATERQKNGSIKPTTCVIKSPKGSDFVGYCWEQVNKKDKNLLEWGQVGPDLLTESVFKHHLDVEEPQVFCPINWFESEKDPPIHREVDTSDSYAVHLWQEMWRRKGLDKNNKYPSSLYERLIDDLFSGLG